MVENGLLALQAFQNARRLNGIIFIDISMPVMNRMDSTQGTRKLECERGHKPAMIITLTYLVSASIQQEAFSNGNFFLTKGVSFNALRRFLDDWTPNMDPQPP
jgi:CheY-like chemotaxis protein